MSQIHSSRRLRWLVVGALAAILTIGSIAVGIAHNGTPDKITLVLSRGTSEFVYGNQKQKIHVGNNKCSVNPDKNGAGLVTVTQSTVDKKNKPVAGKLGLVNDGLGVSEKGNSKDDDCGTIDYLGNGKSESMSFAAGPAIKKQVFTYVDFDLDAKRDSTVRFDFYRAGTIVGTQLTTLVQPNNKHSKDSWGGKGSHDSYRVFAYPTAPSGPPTTDKPTNVVPFDRVVLTVEKGSVSVSGGSDSGKQKNGPTVFYLTKAVADISIDTLVAGYDSDDLGFIPAGTELKWTFVVTNTGDLPLTKVSVTDNPGLSISGPRGDDGDKILSSGEVWKYTATSRAKESVPGGPGQVHVTTVSARGPDKAISASDTVTYFGTTSRITLDKSTSGSNDGGVYSGPGDNVLINAGDKVTWTYRVTNFGNVPLAITVTDTPQGAANCPGGALAPGKSVDCTITGTAETSAGTATASGTYDVGYENSAVARGTHTPTGKYVEATDGSGYFGMNRNLYVEVTNNGLGDPPVVSTPEVVWTVFARNDGNVEVSLVIAQEDLPEGATPNQCDLAASLMPGESDSCEIRTVTVDGEQTTSFTVRGEDPLGVVIEQTSGVVGYYGGLACGESTTTGGPGVDDTPLAGFFVGPATKGDPDECAVPVDLLSTNDPSASEQTVFLGAPDGYVWTGVTGLLTVEWDIEDPAVGLQPTLQVLGVTTSAVPTCAGDVAVEIADPAPGNWMYTLINNPGSADGSYPNATGGGDVCVVFSMLKTINYLPPGGGPQVVRQITTEVFYIYNDPLLTRPR